MAATAAWLAWAESLLNRCIDQSARAAALARRLDGTSLQVEIVGITRIRASAHHGRLALSNENGGASQAARDPAAQGDAAAAVAAAADAAAADAVISGSLPALLQLFNSGAAPQRQGAAQIRGDAEVANRYRELFMLARPDPEEELSRWIGDFPARRLSQFARHALEAARRVGRTAGENIAEYLQEEGRDLVNQTELEEFLRGVDDVRETADRIEARLKRLESRAGGAR